MAKMKGRKAKFFLMHDNGDEIELSEFVEEILNENTDILGKLFIEAFEFSLTFSEEGLLEKMYHGFAEALENEFVLMPGTVFSKN